ncbi:MAG: TetR family transcriptional regulator C-terminal domain-containing protein [Desulfatitalea sp.]
MKERDAKKIELLEAGSAVMLRQGYHGTGVQEIVDAAGVPKGSFYNYFKSKEDFVIAAMEHASRERIQDFERALKDPTHPPAERIVRVFEAMRDAYVRENNYTKGCFVGNMCQEMADTHAAVAEKAEYLFRNYTTALARCIRESQGPARRGAGHDPDKLAEFIFNSWEGAMLRMKSSRNAHPLNTFIDTLKKLLA